MNMNFARAAAAGAFLLAFAGAVSAQQMKTPAAGTSAQPMQHRFVQMQQMMVRAHNTANWNERMRLMQSHMQLMQQQMGSMMGMMGMSMQPGQRMGSGMMSGRGGQGMGRNMTSGNAGDVQAQMAAMQARMREMARMMQQMMEQQQLMLQKAAGPKDGG
ncbi:MAG: hypothetical protein WCB49_08590 [Gammaproteobacteria bacterium]